MVNLLVVIGMGMVTTAIFAAVLTSMGRTVSTLGTAHRQIVLGGTGLLMWVAALIIAMVTADPGSSLPPR